MRGLQVLEMVNTLFDLLEDGTWHNLTEIADTSSLDESKLEIVTNFLAEYDFIELNKVKRNVKLAVSVVDFLKKIKHIENDEG